LKKNILKIKYLKVVEEGVTGIIFDTIDEGVEAVKRVHKMDRALVRETFEKRFTSEIMAGNYLKVKNKIKIRILFLWKITQKLIALKRLIKTENQNYFKPIRIN